MPDNENLVWKKRCRRERSLAADRRILETRCGRYRVVQSHIRYGHEIADCYYAMEIVCGDDGVPRWEIISRHRKRQPAINACVNRHRGLKRGRRRKLKSRGRERRE